jgi:hypothetical protein
MRWTAAGRVYAVIPAKAGINFRLGNMDARVRGHDGTRCRGYDLGLYFIFTPADSGFATANESSAR